MLKTDLVGVRIVVRKLNQSFKVSILSDEIALLFCCFDMFTERFGDS